MNKNKIFQLFFRDEVAYPILSPIERVDERLSRYKIAQNSFERDRQWLLDQNKVRLGYREAVHVTRFYD